MQVLQDFHRLFMSNSTTLTIFILHNYLENMRNSITFAL